MCIEFTPNRNSAPRSSKTYTVVLRSRSPSRNLSPTLPRTFMRLLLASLKALSLSAIFMRGNAAFNVR